jgi:hypothetical protein
MTHRAPELRPDKEKDMEIRKSRLAPLKKRGISISMGGQGDRIILVTPPTSINGKIQTWELVSEREPANA